MRAHLAHTRGALQEALDDAEAGLALAGGLTIAVPLLARGAHPRPARARRARAARALENPGLAEGSGRALTFGWLLHARGRLRLAERRDEEGRRDLLDCGALHEHLGAAALVHPDWRSEAAPALLELGERDEAKRLVARQLELARSSGAPRGLGNALRAAGVVEGERDSLEALAEAVAVLERSPARLELARALTDQGHALRKLSRRRESRKPLRRAVRLVDSCGASRSPGARSTSSWPGAAGAPRSPPRLRPR